MGLYSALLVYCNPAFRLGSVFSWEDVITVVIRDLLSSSCPNELNKEASIITDLDCAEAGSDHLQLLDTFYHHRKYNLKNCHQRDPSKGPRKPTATPGLAARQVNFVQNTREGAGAAGELWEMLVSTQGARGGENLGFLHIYQWQSSPSCPLSLAYLSGGNC